MNGRLVLLLVVGASACDGKGVASANGLTVAISPESPLAGDALECVIVTEAVFTVAGEDTADTAEDGFVVTYAYLWTRDDEVASTDGVIPEGQTARGQTWAVEVTPFGPEGDTGLIAGDPASASVVIGDTPPTLDAVSIGPSAPTETTTITATLGSAFDVDGDAIAFTYDWSVNGEVVRSGTDDTLTGADFSKGDEVSLAVTPSDDAAVGTAATSGTLTILDTPPTFDALAISPETLTAGTLATCVPGGWSDVDGDPEGYRFVWTVEGDVVGTDATLDGALYSRGDDVQCEATANDGDADGPTLVSAAVTVDNAAPVLSSASLSTLTPSTSDTLSITLGSATDADGDYIVYQYEWFVDGASVGSSSTLSPSHFTSGDSVWAEVTPWDARDYGVPVMTDVATVL